MKKIQYGKQCIEEDDIEAVVNVLRGDLITQGPKVEEFERNFANYCNTKYAVAFCNGTSALHAAYNAAGLGEGDELITTTNTFLSTANAGEFLNATTVFCDISMDSYNIDTEEIAKKIGKKTKIITPVSYSGYPVDIVKIKEIAGDKIVVIEDAAHALGAKRYNQNVGKQADMTMFSFHPIKHITTGEGGMITTDNEEYYEKLKLFRNHGTYKNAELAKSKGLWYYEMAEIGYNYRLTDIQAALGISQLKKADRFVSRRREIEKKYDEAFNNIEGIKIPPNSEKFQNSYHLYPILIENRDKLYHQLREENIYCQINYIPLHFQPYYKKKYSYKVGDYKNAEQFYEKELSIPMYPSLTNEEVDYLIEIIVEKIRKL